MKNFLRLIIFFSLIVITLVFSAPSILNTSTYEPSYARIKYNNVLLYKSPTITEESNNTYFILEKGYYVKLISDQNTDFVKVEYMDLFGFVKKSQIEYVNGLPNKPYLDNITFNTYPNSSVFLRSTPTNELGELNVVTMLTKNTVNLTYYGKLTGQEAIDGLGNLWYYCKYIDGKNNQNYGYIYSPLTINLSPITSNIEAIPLSTINPFDKINSFLNISNTLFFSLIFLTSLPMLVILYLLFKPSTKT